MSGRSAKNNNRGSDLFGMFVSGKFKEYHTAQFASTVLTGLTATGGTISDYTDGGNTYRAHIFTSSGALNVTALGGFGNTVEYLVVAGGGGAGGARGAGGGAGGFRTGTGLPVSISPHTVTVGGGGAAAVTPGFSAPPGTSGSNGGLSTFEVTGDPVSSITSSGGGGGAIGWNGYSGLSGGSGGGGGDGGAGGAGNTPPVSPPQGNAGGPGGGNVGGGGGGAGAVGSGTPTNNGGNGTPSVIAGPLNTSVGTPGPAPGRWFAGGGGGQAGSGGSGGGGAHGDPSGVAGTSNTGGGGGSAPGIGASGGSGIVIVSYRTL